MCKGLLLASLLLMAVASSLALNVVESRRHHRHHGHRHHHGARGAWQEIDDLGDDDAVVTLDTEEQEEQEISGDLSDLDNAPPKDVEEAGLDGLAEGEQFQSDDVVDPEGFPNQWDFDQPKSQSGSFLETGVRAEKWDIVSVQYQLMTGQQLWLGTASGKTAVTTKQGDWVLDIVRLLSPDKTKMEAAKRMTVTYNNGEVVVYGGYPAKWAVEWLNDEAKFPGRSDCLAVLITPQFKNIIEPPTKLEEFILCPSSDYSHAWRMQMLAVVWLTDRGASEEIMAGQDALIVQNAVWKPEEVIPVPEDNPGQPLPNPSVQLADLLAGDRVAPGDGPLVNRIIPRPRDEGGQPQSIIVASTQAVRNAADANAGGEQPSVQQQVSSQQVSSQQVSSQQVSSQQVSSQQVSSQQVSSQQVSSQQVSSQQVSQTQSVSDKCKNLKKKDTFNKKWQCYLDDPNVGMKQPDVSKRVSYKAYLARNNAALLEEAPVNLVEVLPTDSDVAFPWLLPSDTSEAYNGLGNPAFSWAFEMEGNLVKTPGILQLYRPAFISGKDWCGLKLEDRVALVRCYLYNYEWHRAPKGGCSVTTKSGTKVKLPTIPDNQKKPNFDSFVLCTKCVRVWGRSCQSAAPKDTDAATWVNNFLAPKLHQESVGSGTWEVTHASFARSIADLRAGAGCLLDTICPFNQCPTSFHVHLSFIPPRSVELLQSMVAHIIWLGDYVQLHENFHDKKSWEKPYFSYPGSTDVAGMMNTLPWGYLATEFTDGATNWGDFKCARIALRHGVYGPGRIGVEFRVGLNFGTNLVKRAGDVITETADKQAQTADTTSLAGPKAGYSKLTATLEAIEILARPLTRLAKPGNNGIFTVLNNHAIALTYNKKTPKQDTSSTLLGTFAPYQTTQFAWSFGPTIVNNRRVQSCSVGTPCNLPGDNDKLVNGAVRWIQGNSWRVDRLFRKLTMWANLDYYSLARYQLAGERLDVSLQVELQDQVAQCKTGIGAALVALSDKSKKKSTCLAKLQPCIDLGKYLDGKGFWNLF